MDRKKINPKSEIQKVLDKTDLDEKVAALHLAKLGVELETLNHEQAEYIGVQVEGPYKPEYYRY